MALITGRQVWFYEDNIGPLRFGIVERASTIGRLIVRVTDGLDSLREIGIEPEQEVFYSDDSARRSIKPGQFSDKPLAVVEFLEKYEAPGVTMCCYGDGFIVARAVGSMDEVARIEWLDAAKIVAARYKRVTGKGYRAEAAQ